MLSHDDTALPGLGVERPEEDLSNADPSKLWLESFELLGRVCDPLDNDLGLLRPALFLLLCLSKELAVTSSNQERRDGGFDGISEAMSSPRLLTLLLPLLFTGALF